MLYLYDGYTAEGEAIKEAKDARFLFRFELFKVLYVKPQACAHHQAREAYSKP